MILLLLSCLVSWTSFTRMSGDDPEINEKLTEVKAFYPHERG